MVSSTLLGFGDVIGLLEFMQDGLGASLSDADLVSNFLHLGIWVFTQINQNVPMIGQEGPASFALRHGLTIPEI